MNLGFINLNKPLGWTSHDCVGKVRRFLRTKRVGHGGTLDPAASGVLPIAFGRATRLLPYLPKQKAYRGKVRFGLQTTTDDLEGEAIATMPASHLTLEAIQPYLAQFISTITQIPPAFSAIHQDGKRLYELARQGIAVDVPSRQVEISELKILGWQDGEFPELDLEIHCGEGTYIRAIARDLGQLAGVGGTLAGLERILSGGLAIANSISLDELAAQIEQQTFTPITPREALPHLARLTLEESQIVPWSHGRKLPFENLETPVLAQPLLICDRQENCLGIGEFMSQDQGFLLIPRLVLESR